MMRVKEELVKLITPTVAQAAFLMGWREVELELPPPTRIREYSRTRLISINNDFDFLVYKGLRYVFTYHWHEAEAVRYQLDLHYYDTVDHRTSYTRTWVSLRDLECDHETILRDMDSIGVLVDDNQ